MKLRLVNVTQREGDVKEFSFQPPESFTWVAGQYMHYVLPHEADDRGIERWFTISSAPSESDVRITTRINHEHSSSFKDALQQLEIGDEIEAEEHSGHARNVEQPAGQRRGRARAVGVAEIGGAGGKDLLSGKEFQRRRIGCRLGLDEHGLASAAVRSARLFGIILNRPDLALIQACRRIESRETGNGFPRRRKDPPKPGCRYRHR